MHYLTLVAGLIFTLHASLQVQCHSHQVPLRHPAHLSQHPFGSSSTTAPAAARVAVIGAGAGGSSAAFWIAKAKERYGLDVEIDVYERNSYVGGRDTVVHPYDNPEIKPIELGASIFVEVNKNMWRAVHEFGFERASYKDAGTVMGVWDGSQFVLTVRIRSTGGSFYSSWWDKVKIMWRYGYKAPLRTQAIVKSMTDTIESLYGPYALRFENLTSLVEALNWTSVVGRTTAELLDAEDINPQWTRELVEAATRVNYAQNVDTMHALEGLCSLAAAGASSVKGGNYQIFEQFLKRSGAAVYLNRTVASLAYDPDTALWHLSTEDQAPVPQPYRAVVLAAPYHQASIDISPSGIAQVPPPQPYVRLHVTVLTTPSAAPNPAHFNMNDSRVPTYIMTSHNGVRQGSSPEPDFVALAFHGQLRGADGDTFQGIDGEEHVVKIFSRQRLSDEWLEGMFGKVGWLLRKEWDAYPVLPPTTTFPPIKLASGFYYVNAFEPLISTMETETLAARNVVELLLREEFDAAICPVNLKADEPNATTNDSGKDFVLGWDC
ncbi:FAD/NAD(P)-binding domain-containing protein [Daedalea quercina L-15889]|uniref:FAD/NAD(P)-binding domain-containing protein n=1 Tax=Daedalea quercina L-15889 TaxID=1314783 RepID=A0A165P4H8_9APHY|nr:FAD/NAD(P)-binding domain-containing protein [Daedalea quercina L-15889]